MEIKLSISALTVVTFLINISGVFPNWWWTKSHVPSSRTYSCIPPNDPANGSVSIIHNGGKASYSCIEGYSLKGHKSRPCCENTWLGNEPRCLRDGQWGIWGPWTACSATCGNGTKQRKRACDSPPPEPHAQDCKGNATEKRLCFLEFCSACDVKELRGPVTARVSEDGVTAHLSCHNGCEVTGGDKRTCDPISGNWSDTLYKTMPCQKKCQPLSDPKNGTVHHDSINGAVYFCDFGFQLMGSPERRCRRGSWTGVEAICLKNGTRLGASPISLESGVHVITSQAFLAGNESGFQSISFYYRLDSSVGGRPRNVSAMVQLMNGNVSVGDAQYVNLRNVSDSELTLIPICVQMTISSDISFEATVQITVTVPNDTAVEIRGIETSQTQLCGTRDGECPFVSEAVGRCGTYCQHDGNCPEPMKCCSTECGVACVYPTNGTNTNGTAKRRRRRDTSTGFQCTDDTTTGSCGFKTTVCSQGGGWTATVGDDPTNLETTNFELPTLYSPGYECATDVCIECLTERAQTVDSSTLPPFPGKQRRRRATDISGKKWFCLPDVDGKVNYDEMITDWISSVNDKISFYVDMFSGGFQIMTVHIGCGDLASSSQINLEPEVYARGSYWTLMITHFEYFKHHEKRVVIDRVRARIEDQFPGGLKGCPEYRVKFRVGVVLSPACVSGISFSPP
eukprot:m.233391 g.233391  ORF g.233391 m.233391 type:complete len:681 (+) comp40087_c0_seq12:18-2060(+)